MVQIKQRAGAHSLTTEGAVHLRSTASPNTPILAPCYYAGGRIVDDAAMLLQLPDGRVCFGVGKKGPYTGGAYFTMYRLDGTIAYPIAQAEIDAALQRITGP